MGQLFILLSIMACVSGCIRYRSAEELRIEKYGEDMFMFSGMPTHLRAEGQSVRPMLSSWVQLSDQLTPEEWDRVLVLVGRIPYIDMTVDNVSGPHERQGIKTMTILTQSAEIFLVWDIKRDRWSIGSVGFILSDP